MIHGPPAAGKSFLALDIIMHMAAQKGSWNGHRTAGGMHVYLCGEGHHGLRSRIAAWKQHHSADHIDMHISTSGCDINTPEGYAKALEALLSLPEPPLSITIDTVHRFYAGDENSAKDVRSMIVACDALRERFDCAVNLVHHTGVSEEAQHRARGSSAWRGALDVEISVVPPQSEGGPIEVVQRKQKDAEMAAPLAFRFHQVEIDGWFDEHGDPVTSVVLERTEPPAKSAAADSTTSAMRDLRSIWEASGRERDSNGKPYITRSAAKNWLIENGNKESSAEQKVKPSGRFLKPLIDQELIELRDNGWSIISQPHVQQWTLLGGLT